MSEENDTAEISAHGWYAKFKNRNFDFKCVSRSGRLVEFDEKRLIQLSYENSKEFKVYDRIIERQKECF